MSDKVVCLNAPGGVDQFSIRDQGDTKPGLGQIKVRQQVIGTNFLDIYHRQGLYPLPAYPAVIGVEAAGLVEAIGPDVVQLQVGDRVAYAGPPVGAYCSTRVIDADRVVPVPESVPLKVAAASLLKGMTAYLLLRKTFDVTTGTTMLIHAAAGGLGNMLVRYAKSLGAMVIGTVGSSEKAVIAQAAGADHVIIGRHADIVAEIMRLTNGRGVDVAYDGIGGDMLIKSLSSVRPFGMVVTIGQAAGPIPPVPVEALRPGKSLSHPSIMAWCSEVDQYRDAAQAAMAGMEKGIVARISREYSLGEVAQAHMEIEAGHSAGSVLLIP